MDFPFASLLDSFPFSWQRSPSFRKWWGTGSGPHAIIEQMRVPEIPRAPHGAPPSLTSRVRLQAPQRTGRLSSRGCVFCLQYTVWVDSGKRSNQSHQEQRVAAVIFYLLRNTAAGSCLWGSVSAPRFCFSGMGAGVEITLGLWSEEPSVGAVPFCRAMWSWTNRFWLWASVFLWLKKGQWVKETYSTIDYFLLDIKASSIILLGVIMATWK